MRAMRLTYFFDVCSMWCALGDEVLAEIEKRYGDRLPITRKIALINDGAPMAAGLDQERWYYERCELVTGRRFDHRWIESWGQSTVLPNALIHAAGKLGRGYEVHEALKAAGMMRGEPILRRDVSVPLAVAAGGVERARLEKILDDPSTTQEMAATTAEFNLLGVSQRPAFVLKSAIEDTAIFSGIYRLEPILAAAEAMIADEDAYERFASSHPPIPPGI